MSMQYDGIRVFLVEIELFSKRFQVTIDHLEKRIIEKNHTILHRICRKNNELTRKLREIEKLIKQKRNSNYLLTQIGEFFKTKGKSQYKAHLNGTFYLKKSSAEKNWPCSRNGK